MTESIGLFDDAQATTRVSAALEVRDVVLDPIFGKRRDALLRTVPIHDLVDRAARADSGLTTFDVRALALAAFDAVIARQGFPDRTTPEQVLTLLTGIAAVQDPKIGQPICHAVAEHVLDGLTNRRERERQFTFHSVVYAEGEHGEILATSVPRPFWLLREQEDAITGEVYLEASADAINALVGGLDIPIEDQQTALETVLERQLARGELGAAHVTAMLARQITAGYIVQTDELLAETERYLPGTDWQVAAPRLLNDALEHLSECLHREGRLLEHVAGGIDDRPLSDAAGGRRAKISALLTKLLEESRHLHTALMQRLIGARARFLDAQNSQMFRPTLSSVEFDLAEDLLVPTLGLSIYDAEKVAEEYLRAAFGPVAPVVLNWGDFVDALISAPRALPDDPRDTDDSDDLQFRPDPAPMVSRDLLAVAHLVLTRVPLPARLSTLLAACPAATDTSTTAYDLIAAAALRGYDNGDYDTEPGSDQADWAEDPDLVALGMTAGCDATGPVHLLDILGPNAACYSDGVTLEGDGWAGDDLIVCVDRDQLDAILLGERPPPDPTTMQTRTPRGEK